MTLHFTQQKKLDLRSSYFLRARQLAGQIHAHNHCAKFTLLVISYKRNSSNGKSARPKEGQGHGQYL